MSKQIEALKMAIKALQNISKSLTEKQVWFSSDVYDAIQACKEALEPEIELADTISAEDYQRLREQPVVLDNRTTQEPIAWMNDIAFSMDKDKLTAEKFGDIIPLFTHPKEWQGLSGEEFVAIAKSIWGDNLGMGDGYGYTVAWASSYATIEPSSKMVLLLQKIDEALKEKNHVN